MSICMNHLLGVLDDAGWAWVTFRAGPNFILAQPKRPTSDAARLPYHFARSQIQEGRMAWQYDPGLSKVEWAIEYLGIATIKGLFRTVQVSVNIDDPDPTRWSVAATIDTASITGGHPPMDEHVRSADFLDVEQYPTITFKSTRVEQADGRYRVAGDLTLHGVTREVVLDASYGGEATDARGRTKRGFSAQTTLNRKDFGIKGGAPGPVLVAGEQIRVTLGAVINKAD
jgi:polyisoprenoid-binding protein YceI